MTLNTLTPIPVETDDQIRNFRRLFFGPNGYTLPFEASYTAIGVFSVLAAFLLWVMVAVIGQPLLSYPCFYTAVAAGIATKGVMRLTDSETPLSTLPTMALATAKAGRTDTTTSTVKVSAASVRVVHDPWQHAVQHVWRNQ